MTRLEDMDLAKHVACPGCGTDVRMLGVPISGTGLDLHFANTAWCTLCIKNRVLWKFCCFLAGRMNAAQPSTKLTSV